ncbi:MAG TPA: type I-B CRISPR-associated protein Cas5b [bacterium]|nr:type I-B CRISPR-associated protein Cas5b [bacterium]
MKIVVFDLWGDYGHFKVPYTTTSPLTLPIPSKTALYGIIGAMLGYDKRNYLRYFQNKVWKVAIGLKNPVAKTHIAENLLNTKVVKMFARMEKGKSCRTQIRFEFLKNPSFRVYVTSSDVSELQKLADTLFAHKTAYSVSLGISECLANFNFVGCFEENEKNSNDCFIELNSVLPLSSIHSSSEIDVTRSDRKYIKVHAPLEMKEDRELIQSEDFLVETNGKTIFAKIQNFVQIKELNESIVLF